MTSDISVIGENAILLVSADIKNCGIYFHKTADMDGEGYVAFDGIECVCIISADKIKLVPKNPDDIRKLNRHFDDHNFFFHYSDFLDKNQIAYMKNSR